MTVNLFIFLVTALALINSLLTEAVKKTIGTEKPTLVAAILAAITGWGGGVCAYILLGIAFNPVSIVVLILLAPIVWICSTCGYDKVMEVIRQILGTF